MDKVKDGQLSELSVLFDRYHLLLYNFFLKLTADRNASEDLTQTVFYRILRFRHTFQAATGNFKPWLYGMARNIHADFCLQKTKMNLVIIGDADDREEPAYKTTDEEEEQVAQLHKALSKLGALDRELIVMSRYDGLKYAEIARIKNTTVGAVKVQIHRAMKELRLLYFM